MDLTVFYGLGVALIVVGIIVIVAVILLASVSGANQGKVRGAGVIMIGPIPIIFGTDKKSVKTVLALALALTIVVLIIIVLILVFEVNGMLSDEETDEGVAVSGRLLGFLVLGIALVFVGVAVLVVASVCFGWREAWAA